MSSMEEKLPKSILCCILWAMHLLVQTAVAEREKLIKHIWPKTDEQLPQIYLSILAVKDILKILLPLWLWAVIFRGLVRFPRRRKWALMGATPGLLALFCLVCLKKQADMLETTNMPIHLGAGLGIYLSQRLDPTNDNWLIDSDATNNNLPAAVVTFLSVTSMVWSSLSILGHVDETVIPYISKTAAERSLLLRINFPALAVCFSILEPYIAYHYCRSTNHILWESTTAILSGLMCLTFLRFSFHTFALPVWQVNLLDASISLVALRIGMFLGYLTRNKPVAQQFYRSLGIQIPQQVAQPPANGLGDSKIGLDEKELPTHAAKDENVKMEV